MGRQVFQFGHPCWDGHFVAEDAPEDAAAATSIHSKAHSSHVSKRFRLA